MVPGVTAKLTAALSSGCRFSAMWEHEEDEEDEEEKVEGLNEKSDVVA